jgi:hypothetical protein
MDVVLVSRLPCRATAMISCCSTSDSSSTMPLHRGHVMSCRDEGHRHSKAGYKNQDGRA